MVSAIERTPWTTLALTALNVAGALATSLDKQVALEFGFDPGNPSIVAGVASLFLHANLVHLLGNLIFLAAAGPAIELSSKGWRLLASYLAGGAAGLLAHWGFAMATGLKVPLVGASGAIAGCVGYASVRFAHVKVPALPKRAVSVGWFCVLWVALQAAGWGFAMAQGASVAYWAHLGGFIGGVLAALLLSANRQAELQFGHSVLDSLNQHGPAAMLAAADRVLAIEPGDPSALRKRADALHDLHEPDEEAAVIAQILENPSGDASHWVGRLADAGKLASLSSMQRMKLAGTVGGEMALVIYKSVLTGPKADPQRAEAALALAQLAEGQDRLDAQNVLTTEYALHPATDLARSKGLLP